MIAIITVFVRLRLLRIQCMMCVHLIVIEALFLKLIRDHPSIILNLILAVLLPNVNRAEEVFSIGVLKHAQVSVRTGHALVYRQELIRVGVTHGSSGSLGERERHRHCSHYSYRAPIHLSCLELSL
jgi:hypothetical protein